MVCNGLEIKAADLEEIVLQTVKTQVAVIGRIDLDSDKIQLSSMEQAEQEKRLLALKDGKRQLYERYIRKEITIQEFMTEKTALGYYIETVESILENMRKTADELAAKYEEEARLKKLAQAASSPKGLSQELAERTVNKVRVFHGNKIEVESSLQDAFGCEENRST